MYRVIDLHYRYTFHVVIICCLQGKTIRVKAVRNHPLKFEQEMRSMHCNSVLFLVRVFTTTDVHIDENVYSNNVLSCATTFHLYASFAVGRASAATLMRSSRLKTSSMEIMVNKIEALIMKDRSPTFRELGAMLDNFCMSFFSSLKFGPVNSNRFYAICCGSASEANRLNKSNWEIGEKRAPSINRDKGFFLIVY